MVMNSSVTLYMFTGSAPSLTAECMLRHKGLGYRRKHLMVGPHAVGMLMRDFDTMTVPALTIDGRRVQGSCAISRALDELQPDPPLFPADPKLRRIVQHAERRGEELQDAARRICLYAAQQNIQTFASVYGHPSARGRAVQWLLRPTVIRLASAAHRATARAVEDDLADLPRRLDEIDAWIADGVLGGEPPNAADLQIAPNIALLLRFEDLEPLLAGRPAARLADRLAPDFPSVSAVALRGTLPDTPAPRGAAPMTAAERRRVIDQQTGGVAAGRARRTP